MKRMLLGIDGGKQGGFVLLNQSGGVVKKWIMPLNDDDNFNPKGIIDIIAECFSLSIYGELIVCLEHAHPRPISGKRACFMNGYGYGLVIGILHASGIKAFYIVNPNTWMKEVLGKDRDKKIKGSIQWCKNKYPEESWTATTRSKKPHTGLTDACAIAVWGLQQEVMKS